MKKKTLGKNEDAELSYFLKKHEKTLNLALQLKQIEDKINKEKKRLEAKIKEEILHFYNKTGMEVNEVNIDDSIPELEFDKYEYNINVIVKLNNNN